MKQAGHISHAQACVTYGAIRRWKNVRMAWLITVRLLDFSSQFLFSSGSFLDFCKVMMN
jgi:hypothetical protein